MNHLSPPPIPQCLTFIPKLWSCLAAAKPAGPAPTTRTDFFKKRKTKKTKHKETLVRTVVTKVATIALAGSSCQAGLVCISLVLLGSVFLEYRMAPVLSNLFFPTPWRNCASSLLLGKGLHKASFCFLWFLLYYSLPRPKAELLQPVAYIVVVFREKMLAGSHGENSCVYEAFPRHEVKNPLYFLDASNAHKAPDDDVGNALLRSESFLCLQRKQNQQQESHPI